MFAFACVHSALIGALIVFLMHRLRKAQEVVMALMVANGTIMLGFDRSPYTVSVGLFGIAIWLTFVLNNAFLEYSRKIRAEMRDNNQDSVIKEKEND